MGKPNWMKFDPDKIALDVDGMSLEQEGAYMRCVRHIWRNGPLPEARLSKVCGNAWDAVKACAAEYEGGLSFSWLEDARTDAQGRSKRASVAGVASFNSRSTDVQQPFNGRSTDVLSISKSSSTSKSTSQEGKERAHEAEIEPTFKQWFDLYAKSRDKEACRAKWTALGQDIHEAIMEHTRRYVVAQPDKLYRKDPIRYLTKRGWEDEIVESKTNGTRTNTHDPDERRRLGIEANAEHFRQQREFEARHQPGGIPDPAHG